MSAQPISPGRLRVTVAVSTGPRQVLESVLTLPSGARVCDALLASAENPAFAGIALESFSVGVWGRKAGLQRLLHDGDRVECYRPLQVDPKVARRERFARQGARSAGLFAHQRAGGKAGY